MTKLKYTIIVLFFVLLPFVNNAQPPGDPSGDPDNPVPIGGIELLLIAGGALGIRKLMGPSKKK